MVEIKNTPPPESKQGVMGPKIKYPFSELRFDAYFVIKCGPRKAEKAKKNARSRRYEYELKNPDQKFDVYYSEKSKGVIVHRIK